MRLCHGGQVCDGLASWLGERSRLVLHRKPPLMASAARYRAGEPVWPILMIMILIASKSQYTSHFPPRQYPSPLTRTALTAGQSRNHHTTCLDRHRSSAMRLATTPPSRPLSPAPTSTTARHASGALSRSGVVAALSRRDLRGQPEPLPPVPLRQSVRFWPHWAICSRGPALSEALREVTSQRFGSE